MFMYSLRFNRKLRRSAMLILLLLGIMTAGRLVMGMLPQESMTAAGAGIKKQEGKTEQQRQEFIASLGWQVNPEPDEVSEIVIPKKFDELFESYNEIQKQQGCDLYRYRGKRCKKYCYTVLNHPDGGENIKLSLIVCKNKIIGGDVASQKLDGFMHGLMPPLPMGVSGAGETASPQAAG